MSLSAMTHSAVPTDNGRLARWQRSTSWLLQAVGGAVFVGAGLAKLTGAASMIATFEALGVGQWFRFFTGGMELLGALLLLSPNTAGLGAALLAGVMIGASAAHLLILHISPLLPLALLMAMSAIVWLRREQLLELLTTRLDGES